MSLPANLKADYAPGGRLYLQLTAQYGIQAAEDAYEASKWGERDDVAAALFKYRNAEFRTQPGSASTIGNFFTQITTDPLAAPLESANNQIGKAVWNVVKNPFVLAVVALLVWWKLGFPGAPALKKKLA